MAFWGRGVVSNAIRFKTFLEWPPWAPNPSHVGVVLDTWEDAGHRWRVNVVESTSLDGFTGVAVNRLSERLRAYEGTVAVARVRHGRRYERERAYHEALRHIGKQYDFENAIKAGMWLATAADDAERIFCSELSTRMHQAAGWLPNSLNPDEVIPKEMVRFSHLAPLERIRY